MVVLLQLSGMAVAEESDSCAGLGVTPYADQSDPNIAIGRQTPDTISSLTATITHDPGNPNIPQNAIVRLEFGGMVILDLSQVPSGTCKLTASYDDIRGRGVTGGSQWDKCISALP